MVSVAAFAQGVVVFNNRVGTEVYARVLLPDGTGVGAWFRAQLYAGPEGTPLSALTPLFPVTTFRTSSQASQGYVNSVDVTIPNLSPGEKATFVMKAYNGSDFESSQAKGESEPFIVMVGGGNLPPTNLVGLKGFGVAGTGPGTDVEPFPEPSSITLALLGSVVLLFCRRG